MSLGLKRGTVRLEAHDPAWDAPAREVIAALWAVLGSAAVDIQHVGSTAVPKIAAKPIVDIAVAVKRTEALEDYDDELAKRGIVFRKTEFQNDRLYVMGDGETRTHHIHMVCADSTRWKNYIALRDYLNANEAAADRYFKLKRKLAEQFAEDRNAYTQGKSELIERLLDEAAVWRRSDKNEQNNMI